MLTSPSIVNELNTRRSDAVKNGSSPYAGNLKDYSTFSESYSPTVITDANIRENVIPDVKNELNRFNTPSKGILPSAENPQDAQSPFLNDYKDVLGAYGMNGTSQEDVQTATENDPLNKQFMDIYKRAQKSNDQAYRASLEGINANIAKMKQRAQQGSQAINSVLAGAGATRYAPQGAIRASTRHDLDYMDEIANKEQTLLAQANEAYNTKDMELADKLLGEVKTLRSEKLKVANTVNETIAEQNKAAREQEKQASRDSAIAGLISQDITDPSQIIDYLNYDDAGNRTGDFTIKEVSDTLENLKDKMGYDSLEKLSGDVRDFYLLQKMQKLPGEIASLPPDQQFSAYMNLIKPPKAGSGGGTGGAIKSGNLIFTREQQGQASTVLNQSRGTDNFVNSDLYIELYNEWVAQGGLLKDFLSAFPANQYINPNDPTVPYFLKPYGTASKNFPTDSKSSGSSGSIEDSWR